MRQERQECFECGSTEEIQNHHVVPRSLGGTKTIPLCGKCHSIIHQSKGLLHNRTRTKAGLDAARARGVIVGRPRSMTDEKANDAILLASAGLFIREIAELMHVSIPTVYRRMSAAKKRMNK